MAEFSERKEKWVTIDEDELKEIIAVHLGINKSEMGYVSYPVTIYTDSLSKRIRIYLNG